MEEGEGKKRKEGRSSLSALSLFRFHLSPFPQKRLILRLSLQGRRQHPGTFILHHKLHKHPIHGNEIILTPPLDLLLCMNVIILLT